MINLGIDISDLALDLSLSQSQQDNMVEFAVDEVAAGFYNAWAMQARSDLFKSRSAYIANLGVEKAGRFKSVVFLNPSAWLPNAIEKGASAFDMKVGMLKSNKVKFTKKGKPYLTIPFRFATEGAIGDNPVFAGVLPSGKGDQRFSNVVKQAEKRDGNKNGLPMSDIKSRHHIPESSTLRKMMKSSTFTKLESGTKMTSLYAGLKRNEKGSGYVMFRRVSLNSPADKFQHDGLQARNLAEKALSSFEPLIPNIVGDSIRSMI